MFMIKTYPCDKCGTSIDPSKDTYYLLDRRYCKSCFIGEPSTTEIGVILDVVYVVMYHWHDYSLVLGVFSDRHLAEKFRRTERKRLYYKYKEEWYDIDDDDPDIIDPDRYKELTKHYMIDRFQSRRFEVCEHFLNNPDLTKNRIL